MAKNNFPEHNPLDTEYLTALAEIVPPPLDVPKRQWQAQVKRVLKSFSSVPKISLSVQEAMAAAGINHFRIDSVCRVLANSICAENPHLFSTWHSPETVQVRKRVGQLLSLEIRIKQHPDFSKLFEYLHRKAGKANLADIAIHSEPYRSMMTRAFTEGTEGIKHSEDLDRLNDNKAILEMALSNLCEFPVEVTYDSLTEIQERLHPKKATKVSKAQKGVSLKPTEDEETSPISEVKPAVDIPVDQSNEQAEAGENVPDEFTKDESTPTFSIDLNDRQSLIEQLGMLSNAQSDFSDLYNASLEAAKKPLVEELAILLEKKSNLSQLNAAIKAKQDQQKDLRAELKVAYDHLDSVANALGLSREEVMNPRLEQGINEKEARINHIEAEIKSMLEIPQRVTSVEQKLKELEVLLNLMEQVRNNFAKISTQLEKI